MQLASILFAMVFAPLPVTAEVSVGDCSAPSTYCEPFLDGNSLRAGSADIIFTIGISDSALEACDRTTHISHAGENAHRDIGAGRVAYAEWWSQEGVYLDLVIANCETGTALTTRTHEERISPRPPFDVTEKARALIEIELAASPSLFSFERLATALKGTGRDIEIAQLSAEPCACAAVYPELRGFKTPFEEEQ